MERHYNPEAEKKYKKTLKNFKLCLIALFCIIGVSFVACLLFLPFENLTNALIGIGFTVALSIAFKFLIEKSPAWDIEKLKEEAYGKEVELSATNEVFEEIIRDYHSIQRIFLKSLAPKPWKKVDIDDRWGNIYVTFKKGANTMDFEFSDTQVAVIFNKESNPTEYTQALASFSNVVEISDYVNALRQQYFEK